MDQEQATQLLTEQFKHLNTLYKARFDALEEKLNHAKQITDQRLSTLETTTQDHETRIREATQGVTQFKLFSGLASGSSSLMSIVALIKAFLNF
jgi:hypothetical protein